MAQASNRKDLVNMRKLNFNEILLVSKILREMGTKAYVEYAIRMNERLTEKMKKDVSKSDEEKKKAKDDAIGIDVAIFVLENMDLARDSLFELFASYNEISAEEAKKLDFDKIVETVQNIIKAGLPDALMKILKKTGINFLAKANV